jgi:diadenosine tetraphosphate (Ap4A) HIT family hydrolase
MRCQRLPEQWHQGRPAQPHVHIHVVPRYQYSDPKRLFLEREFPIISMTEQNAIATAIRAAL